MNKEAMKLAQKWQQTDWNTESPMSADFAVSEAHDVINALIDALREALAEQQEQEPVEVQMRVGSSYWAKVDRNTPAEQLAKAQQLMQDNPGVYEMRTLYTSHSRRRTHEQTN